MRILQSTAIVALAVLAGCASVPAPLQGEYATVSPREAIDTGRTGVPVRWGGRIVKTEPLADRTCFEMVSTRLDHTGRPYWAADDTGGRFIACRAGFYDPAIFAANREVTFTGNLAGFEDRRIGEYSYRFPRMDASVVYLWPVRERVDVITRPAPWPWWGYW
ncbi:Slp family lipoprotein [Luteimonas pelagia]